MSDALAHLARLAGIVDHWSDAAGNSHLVDDDTLRALLAAMDVAAATPRQVLDSTARLAERRRLPPALLTTWVGTPTRLGFALPGRAPFRLGYEDGAVVEGHVFDADGARWLPPVLHSGYHQLEIAGMRVGLAVAPLRACSIADLGPTRPRVWGLAMDARTAPDFPTLAALARSAAGYGADALAVGRLAADDRHGLDPARIDPGQTFPARSLPPAIVRDDHAADILRRLYLEALPRDEVLLREFLRFDRDGGSALQTRACHALLRERYGASRRDWPRALADGNAEALDAYTRAHAEDIGFQVFLQWLAARGRGAAQTAARTAGMAIGLIADLDWGAAVDGAEAWSTPRQYLAGLRVADPLHPDGVEAGAEDVLCPDPLYLVEQGFQPWITLLRANMTGVGGLRLRRFPRWQRAWLQPSDGVARGGAYVEQPFDDLLRLLVLESVRQRCIVIVDDVMDLPAKLRDAVEQAGLLPSDAFLRPPGDGQAWIAAGDWPPGGVAISSAAPPSLLDWWRADDIQRRVDRGLLGSLIAARELRQRDEDRSRLLAHLGIERRHRVRDWPEERRNPHRAIPARARVDEADLLEAHLVDEVIGALGRTPAALVLVQLEDLLVDGGDAPIDANAAVHLLDSGAVRSRLGRLDDARRCDPAGHAPARPGGAPSPR